MSKIVPWLWFDDRGEEAANFYVATFRACGQDAAIGEILHYGEAGPRPKGTVLTVTFSLAGQEFSALNGGPQFTFSPASSSWSAHFTNIEIAGAKVNCGPPFRALKS